MSAVYQIIRVYNILGQSSKKINDRLGRIYNMKRSTSGWNAMIATQCAVDLNGIIDVIQVDLLIDRSSTWFGHHPRSSYQLMPWTSSNETSLGRFPNVLFFWIDYLRSWGFTECAILGLLISWSCLEHACYLEWWCIPCMIRIYTWNPTLRQWGVYPTTNYNWLY